MSIDTKLIEFATENKWTDVEGGTFKDLQELKRLMTNINFKRETILYFHPENKRYYLFNSVKDFEVYKR